MAEKSAERLALEAEASLLEIPFGSNWKDATIADKIAEAKAQAAQAITEAEADRQTGSAPIPDLSGEPQGAEGAQTAASAPAAGSGDVASVPDTGGTGGGDTAPAQPEPGAEGAIIVTGPKKGRWRAGRHFTPEPSIILVSDLEPGQREMIEGDLKLTVEFVPPED